MAKARSNMGQKSISSLQYDTREIIPSVTVDCASDDSLSFDLVKNARLRSSTCEDGVRKRVVKRADIETVGTTDQQTTSEAEEKVSEPRTIKDPLLMFGVLVPLALRSSKLCFERSLPVISKICLVQAEIVKLKAEYKSLLKDAESDC